MDQSQRNNRIQIIASFIGCAGLIVAAVIGVIGSIYVSSTNAQVELTPFPVSTGAPIPATVTAEPNSETDEGTAPNSRAFTSVGSGPLSNIMFSDGLAQVSANELSQNHSQIQLFNVLTNPDGCTIAEYSSSLIWFGSTRPTRIFVNGAAIAEFTESNFRASHGGIFEWPVSLGDSLCVDLVPGMEFHLNVGPDVAIHYDSYCFRGFC